MSDIRDFCPLWGEWEVEKKLGEGSFGAVWKVKRNIVGGKVYYAAVKHISIPKDESEISRLIDEGIFLDKESAKHYYSHMLQSISDEIDTMHKLLGYTNIVAYEDHKIIPKAEDIGYDLFLRMELLQPLTDRILQGMSVSNVVSLGKDIATAIDVLYDHNLIHRDIKPQNIFVNDRDVYKLGDYGTVRALGTGATAMSRKGTYNYMSPEIYNNEKADIRADIYSLGLVLYRLLNGNRLPFLPVNERITNEDSDKAVMRRISGEKIPAPKNADAELSAIVLKACAYDPDDRYRTPKEMIRALEEYKGKANDLIQDNNNNDKAAYESGSFEFSFASKSKEFSNSNKAKETAKAPLKSSEEETVAELPPVANKTSHASASAGAKKEPTPPEKKGKKAWLIPLIAVLVLGLIAGGLFAGGIIPPKPVETPVVTETPKITEKPTAEPTTEPTSKPTDTPSPTPTDTPTPEPTNTPTPNPTDTPTPTPTNTPTPTPTNTPTPRPTDTPTPEPTDTPTPVPTDTPTPVPTNTPTPAPMGFGTCGQNMTWQINDGVLLIQGSGKMNDYDYSQSQNAPWYQYRDEIEKIILEDGIISVGCYAFSDMNNLKEVSLPGSLRIISNAAFLNCQKLEQLSIPEGVEILQKPFAYCESLKEISLPKTLKEIRDGLVEGLSSLQSVTLSSNPYFVMEDGVLFDSKKETLFWRSHTLPDNSYTIPRGVITIAVNAFEFNHQLTGINIPDTVKTIMRGAFYECPNLIISCHPGSTAEIFAQKYHIPYKHLSGQESEASSQSADSGVIIPAKSDPFPIGSIVQFGHYDQDGDKNNGLEPIEWYILGKDEQGILLISRFSLEMQSYHNEYHKATAWDTSAIRKSLNNYFYSAAFSKDERAHIVISHVEPAKTIGSINVSQGEATDDYVFLLSKDECEEKYRDILWDENSDQPYRDGLIPMLAPATARASSGNDGLDSGMWLLRGPIFDHTRDLSGLYNIWSVTSACVMQSNKLDCETTNIRPLIRIDSVDTLLLDFDPPLKESAPSGSCGAELTWEISGHTLHISGTGDMDDFGTEKKNEAPWTKYKSSITKVAFDDGITSIGQYAFYNFISLTNVDWPASLREIREYAFSGCERIISLALPEGLVHLAQSSFCNCDELRTLSLPATLTQLDSGFIHNTKRLRTIILADGNPAYVLRDGVLYSADLKTIFCRPAALRGTAYEIPDGTEIIGSFAFDQNGLLEEAAIPQSIIAIENNAFAECIHLRSIAVPNSVTSLGSNVFENCRRLTKATIPEHITGLADGVFSGCTHLEIIDIPESVVQIGDSAFAECKNLRKIRIPNAETEIAKNAFDGCPCGTMYCQGKSPAEKLAKRKMFTIKAPEEFDPDETEEYPASFINYHGTADTLEAIIKDIYANLSRGTRYMPGIIFEQPLIPTQWDDLINVLKNLKISIEEVGDQYILTILEPEKTPLLQNIKEWTVYFYDDSNKKTSSYGEKHIFEASGDYTYTIPAAEVQKRPTNGFSMQYQTDYFTGEKNKPVYDASFDITWTPSLQSISININVLYNDIYYIWSLDKDCVTFKIIRLYSRMYTAYDKYNIDTGELIYSKRQLPTSMVSDEAIVFLNQ